MVSAGRAAYLLHEEHHLYLDQQAQALTGLVFLRLGARFVRNGILAGADDVFMLSLDELKEIAAGTFDAEPDPAVQALVLERKADLARSSLLTPPPFVGLSPAGPPPSGSPMERAHLRVFGGPPQHAAAPNQLKGNPGSRGRASGPARVARTLAEAKAIRPGEILVAITTMPAWTPLFGIAAAVVTEAGGALCHGAIVAREYGIPAVVGATGATREIRSGQRITVDGTTGVVTIDQS
jgi:pyruvate,water dikinase